MGFLSWHFSAFPLSPNVLFADVDVPSVRTMIAPADLRVSFFLCSTVMLTYQPFFTFFTPEEVS